MPYDEIVRALQCGKPSCQCQKWRGDGNLHCPVTSAHRHGDADPGLTTKVTPHDRYGERILFDCKKGCTPETIFAALRGMDLWPPPKSDVALPAAARTDRPRKLVKEWPYKDAQGNVIAWKQRYEYQDAEGGKTFLWRREGSDRPTGLQGLAMEEMPLYNLEGVLDEAMAEAPVYFVEGEKAADALIDHGLIAVSLGGGAAQQKYGDALHPLRGRRVILWPDNDDPGYALMTRLATEMPHARFLRLPEWLGPKEDAYDFFADARGTVQLIEELSKNREPVIRWEDEGETLVIDVEVTTEKGADTVHFEFRDWTISRNVVEVDVVVSIGGQQGEEFEAPARLNLRSLSNCEAYRRILDGFFGKEYGWTKLCTRIFRLAERTYTSAEQSIDLAEVKPDYNSLYRVDGLIPEGQTTILFSAGGAGKTSIVMDLIVGICYEAFWQGRAALPAFSVLYVDYESGPESITRRYWRSVAGHGYDPAPGILNYFRAKGRPIANMVPALKHQIASTGAEILVIDSAAPACGGKPEDSDQALAMFRALEQLHITTILITHVNRQGDKYQPFGSAFWHNEARATHYLEAVGRRRDREDHRFIDLVMYPRKMNDDELPKAMPLTIEFTGPTGPVRVLDGSDTAAGRLADEPRSQSEAVERALQHFGEENLRPTIELVVKYIAETWPGVKTISAKSAGNLLRELVARGQALSGTSARTGRAKVYWLVGDEERPTQQAFGDDEPLPEED